MGFVSDSFLKISSISDAVFPSLKQNLTQRIAPQLETRACLLTSAKINTHLEAKHRVGLRLQKTH